MRSAYVWVVVAWSASVPALAQPICPSQWWSHEAEDRFDPFVACSLELPSADGPGRLLIGGSFTRIDGQSVSRLVRWNGDGWTNMGSGLSLPTVTSLAAYDFDGAGPEPLSIVAGSRSSATIQRSLGQGWSNVGGALGFSLVGLGTLNLPAPELFAWGNGGGVGRIARWNGSAWAQLPPLVGEERIYSAGVFDPDADGPEPARLAVGTAGSTVYTFDGAQWAPLGGVVYPGNQIYVVGLLGFDADGPGPAPAGFFAITNHSVSRWTGAAWETIQSTPELINCATLYDPDGSGPALPLLVVAGFFTTFGGVACPRVAGWNGSEWFPIGRPGEIAMDIANTISAVQNSEGLDGPHLVMGGTLSFNGARGRVLFYACEPGSGCAADFNGDGFVDFLDAAAFTECFEGGGCPGGRSADFNADGFVDFFDFAAFVDAFEAGC